MFDNFFLKSILLGFSIAAPVGPIGILCIQRSLSYGFISGLVSGLGAATADAIYGMIAAFGLTFISSFLIAQSQYLGVGGGLFLCYLGLKTFFKPPASEERSVSQSQTYLGSYLSTFLLTLTNPMTILFFTLIFSGIGWEDIPQDYRTAPLIVLGVFLGSGLWWVVLSSSVGLFRKKFKRKHLGWINRAAGLLIVGFGIWLFLSI